MTYAGREDKRVESQRHGCVHLDEGQAKEPKTNARYFQPLILQMRWNRKPPAFIRKICNRWMKIYVICKERFFYLYLYRTIEITKSNGEENEWISEKEWRELMN